MEVWITLLLTVLQETDFLPTCERPSPWGGGGGLLSYIVELSAMLSLFTYLDSNMLSTDELLSDSFISFIINLTINLIDLINILEGRRRKKGEKD